MITRLFSAALRGIDAHEVEVEVNAYGSEKPLTIIVGLPDAAVRESSQRVQSALAASALSFGMGTKIVNLAPADLKKEGPSFDLPIAIAMAAACEQVQLNPDDCAIIGELGLDGVVRPVKGALSIAMEAKKQGRTRVIVPEANRMEAAIVEGIQVFGVNSLHQTWQFLNGKAAIAPCMTAYFADRSRTGMKNLLMYSMNTTTRPTVAIAFADAPSSRDAHHATSAIASTPIASTSAYITASALIESW